MGNPEKTCPFEWKRPTFKTDFGICWAIAIQVSPAFPMADLGDPKQLFFGGLQYKIWHGKRCIKLPFAIGFTQMSSNIHCAGEPSPFGLMSENRWTIANQRTSVYQRKAIRSFEKPSRFRCQCQSHAHCRCPPRQVAGFVHPGAMPSYRYV